MPTPITNPQQQKEAPDQVGSLLSLKELTTLLIKHHNLHEGRYSILMQYQFVAGSLGPDKANRIPGMMVGVSQVGLVKSANADDANSVDAAEVNAKPKAKERAKGKAKA